MKIILSHVYSEANKGDAALLSVLINDVKELYGKNAEIKILTIDRVEAGHSYDGIAVEPSLMYSVLKIKNRVFKLFFSIFAIYYSLLWAILYQRYNISLPLPKSFEKAVKLYAEADLIIAVGGGYVRGKKGFTSSILLMLLLHPFRLAKILNKPTIIYPQSFGPFYGWFQNYLAKRHLKKVGLIMVRENVSFNLLKSFGLNDNIIRNIDSGFLFDNSTDYLNAKKSQRLDTKFTVGVTVRKWLDENRQEKFENEVANLLDKIIAKYGAKIVFIPQVTNEFHKDDDRVVNKKIFNKLKHQEFASLVEDDLDAHQIKAMYSKLDYLIGTRFHSVIFSITSLVPCIAIEYEHKTRGIMADLGLDQWVVPMEKVSEEELLKMFKRLIDERVAYTEQIKSRLPKYLEQAREAKEILKKFASPK